MIHVKFEGKILEALHALILGAAAYVAAITPVRSVAECAAPKACPPPQAEPSLPPTPEQEECVAAAESALAAEVRAAAVEVDPPPPAKRSRAKKKPEPEPELKPAPPETPAQARPGTPEPLAETPAPVAETPEPAAEAPEPIAETPPAPAPVQDAPAVDADPDGWPTMLTRPPATCEAAELRGWMAQNQITDAELTAAQYKLFQRHRDIISLPSMHMAVKKLGPERWYIAFAHELAAMRKESGL